MSWCFTNKAKKAPTEQYHPPHRDTAREITPPPHSETHETRHSQTESESEITLKNRFPTAERILRPPIQCHVADKRVSVQFTRRERQRKGFRCSGVVSLLRLWGCNRSAGIAQRSLNIKFCCYYNEIYRPSPSRRKSTTEWPRDNCTEIEFSAKRRSDTAPKPVSLPETALR